MRHFNRWLEIKYDKLIQKTVSNLTSIQLLKLKSRFEAVAFIESKIENVLIFSDRPKIRNFVLEKICSVDGDILEFGVAGGFSLRFFNEYLLKHKIKKRIVGFDSFYGLGETWTMIDAYKEFDRGGEIPNDIPDNIELVVGDVKETVPDFLRFYTGKIAFVHIDTDSYLPASIVLKNLKPFLKSGCIILFDDFHSLVGWQFGEHKALNETFGENEFKYLAFGPHQAAIQIH